MFGQTFAPADLGIVAFLVILEALLSADNALVLAIMVRHLPRELQKKALIYGLGGALVFRLLAILLATFVIKLWWLQAIGAAYLLYLPIKHFLSRDQHSTGEVTKAGFWGTVVRVELTDIAFAIDSVLAGVAVVSGSYRGEKAEEKVWVIYFGAIIGVVLLRVAAGMFIRLLERFPVLDHVAYLLVAWVGVKMAFLAGHNGFAAYDMPKQVGWTIPEMSPLVFWTVMGIICVTGTIVALRHEKKASDLEQEAEIVEEIQGVEPEEESPPA